jgi:hypothetical protein
MRAGFIAIIVVTAAFAVPGSSAARPVAAETERIDRTFELAPGARVDVGSISGPVVVEVAESGLAEVHVERSAPSRAQLDCAPMIVEGSADHLVVRVEQRHDSGCRSAQRTDRVRLRLPASVAFTASSVSGDVTVGRLEGPVHLSSISGDVRVGGVSGELDLSSVSGRVEVDRATGYAKISSVSGSVLLAVDELGDRGITANSIGGDVEVRFASPVNADVTVDSISGGVSSDVAASVTKVGSSSYRMRLGSGGTRISLSSISGDVRFTGR